MNVDGTPNVRACMTPAVEGMQVRHQNAYPSLERDWLAVAQRFDALMPVGWYYKTFTHAGAWHRAEPYIRKAAGLGDVPLPDAMRRALRTFLPAGGCSCRRRRTVGHGSGSRGGAHRRSRCPRSTTSRSPAGICATARAARIGQALSALRSKANIEVLAAIVLFRAVRGRVCSASCSRRRTTARTSG